MANLTTKIKLYAKANGISFVDFLTDISVDDDGSGAKIVNWNLDIPQPTDEQLATYESSAQTEENNNAIRATRKSAYGDIGDQLDEIFKDIDAWKTRIQSIKDANPKETE
jgi:hypothetical protein